MWFHTCQPEEEFLNDLNYLNYNYWYNPSSIYENSKETKRKIEQARNIIKNRPIETTLELAEIIKSSVPEKVRRKKLTF